MRAWVVVAVVFAAVVVLWDVYFTLNLLIGLLVSLLVPADPDLPSGFAFGYTQENAVAPFPWVAVMQYGLARWRWLSWSTSSGDAGGRRWNPSCTP
jgi:hypothetical protein